MPRLSTSLLALLWLVPPSARAQWPTTLKDNLPIAADSLIYEGYPTAIPYSDGRTLVVFISDVGTGNHYQIIDRYGEFVFPEAPLLAPASVDSNTFPAQLIPDGNGGAFAAWQIEGTGSYYGTYAQHLDSLGNRVWGDAAIRISTHDSGYQICPDGMGGFYLGIAEADIWAQHVSSSGQLLWGEDGVVVCSESHSQGTPRVTYYDNGLYLVWRDFRPPYNLGALFAQKLDSNGTPLWATNGVFICEHTLFHALIPDEENGFILHTNPGGDVYNAVFRIGPNGDTLWFLDWVSFGGSTAVITPGESGYFYLGFHYGAEFYAQRMSMQGRRYWPASNPGYRGAPFALWPRGEFAGLKIAYRYPYLYGIYCRRIPEQFAYASILYVQRLDSLGNQMLGAFGAKTTSNPPHPFSYWMYLNIVPDDQDGAVAVFEDISENIHHDVFAKHVNADGSLGGPAPPTHVAASTNSRPTLSVSQNIIRYELPSSGRVSLALYNLLGQQVAVLVEGEHIAGSYTVSLNLDQLPSGIYLLQLTTPTGAQTAKVALVR